jgi:hypothetical protein
MYKLPLSLVAIAGFGISTPALLPGSAQADESAYSGAVGATANTIVGLWSTEGDVGLCGFDPINKVFNTLLFHAGGTVVENPRIPPSGVPDVGGGIYQRGQALGTWTFDRRNRTYQIHLRFDNYVDNAYHGYTMVDREITLIGKDQAVGPVYVTRFTADGNLIVELCGQAQSTRL